MSPDDPRHGTYAGALAHRRAGSPTCLPCHVVSARYVKAAKMRLNQGIRNRVPLGQRAWDILENVGCTPVAEASGLWRNNLYRAHRRGPDAQVLRTTRDSILRAAGPTPVGVQRRVRALAALGHTLEVISAASGVHAECLARMSRAAEPPSTRMRTRVLEGIVAAYDELRHVTPPTDRYTKRRRSTAAGRGWFPPDVWDDIDDPSEDPLVESDDNYLDEVVVERLLAGDRIPSTRAEKLEALRRWMSTGRTKNSLCSIHGWNAGQYVVDRQDGAA